MNYFDEVSTSYCQSIEIATNHQPAARDQPRLHVISLLNISLLTLENVGRL